MKVIALLLPLHVTLNYLNTIRSSIPRGYEPYYSQSQRLICLVWKHSYKTLNAIKEFAKRLPEAHIVTSDIRRLKSTYELEKCHVPCTIVGNVVIVSSKTLSNLGGDVVKACLALTYRRLRTIYVKELTEGQYRVAKLQLLYGVDESTTTYREHGLTIICDVKRVYVNPRLSTERLRVLRSCTNDDRVLDMFAGSGALTLLLSTKLTQGIIVSNDLNQSSIHYILKSLAYNARMLKAPVILLNLDAKQLPGVLKPIFTVIIMDCPHESLRYLLHAFRLCEPDYCTLHVYVVGCSQDKVANTVKHLINEFKEFMNHSCRVEEPIRVLDYAPRKYIYRATITCKRLQ